METQIHLSKLSKTEIRPNLLHWANLLYLLIFAASILIAVLPAKSPNDGLPGWLAPAILMIVAQVGGVLIPALLFIWLTRQPGLTTLKLRRLSFGSGVKCLLIGLLCWPIFNTLGTLSTILLSLINPQASATPNTVTNGGSPWIVFIGLVLIAPLFEELLFRGVLLSLYERQVGFHAIWLVAILFGCYHFSLDNLAGPLIIGLLVGWLTYRTRSIWAGVLLHIGVNLFSGLFILVNALAVPAGAEAAAQNTAMLTPNVMWLGIAIWTGVGMVLVVPVFFLLRSFSKRYPAPEFPTGGINLRTIWSTIAVSFVAVVYFCVQLVLWMRQ